MEATLRETPCSGTTATALVSIREIGRGEGVQHTTLKLSAAMNVKIVRYLYKDVVIPLLASSKLALHLLTIGAAVRAPLPKLHTFR